MGNNDKHDLVSVIATIERALHRAGMPVEFGKGAGVVQKHLME
jgi:aspartate aminotransferase-like enzyme